MPLQAPQTLPDTDTERLLGVDELFFSTTDSRGVIQQANSVFVRISGYALDELLGAPHNLVRHPEMPAGVFRLMWSWLASGRPIGTYVCNRTKDGDHYWVHAVVSPVADGFLSVRTAPREGVLETVREVYAVARAAEAEAEDRGAPRREVAEVGEEALLQALREHGFDSYEEFMHDALPAEISARSRAAEAHERPAATGEIAQVLAGTRAVDALLGELVGRLDDYQALGDELTDTSLHVLAMTAGLQGSVVAAQEASALVADKSPVLANVARVMAQPMNEAIADLEKLSPAFAHLHTDIARMRFQIALATLYNEMAAAFAAEVHDGVAPHESLTAVPLLCDAVEACVVEMSQQVQQVNADLDEVAGVVTEAAGLLEDFRRFIGQWRHLVFRHARVQLGEQVRPVDEQISASWRYAEQLQQLAQRASGAIVAFDPAALRSHLVTMRVE